MKNNLKKSQFIETILVAKLEKDLVNLTPSLQHIISKILMGVALYNNILPTPSNAKSEWMEYLTQYFTEVEFNGDIYNNSGFCGSHFYLQNEKKERVLLVYLQKVIIDTNLD